MPRLIEIILFLTPFVAFAAWRLWFPSPLPPPGLIYGLAVFVGLMLAALLWTSHLDAEDGHQAYVPAVMQNGRIIEGHPAASP
ncbi:hypothetical protein [Acidisphaera sp. S103]|uniref:hypothetical protein n=1 Tax=Acidisphaera sp. S103 TaxID=1747223 RepID=UPI00131C976E|nr:hypothetical protein [Acidisphaera sp. S103]